MRRQCKWARRTPAPVALLRRTVRCEGLGVGVPFGPGNPGNSMPGSNPFQQANTMRITDWRQAYQLLAERPHVAASLSPASLASLLTAMPRLLQRSPPRNGRELEAARQLPTSLARLLLPRLDRLEADAYGPVAAAAALLGLRDKVLWEALLSAAADARSAGQSMSSGVSVRQH